MLISIKESYKQIGILVIMACAIFISTLFLNFSIDLYEIEEQLTTPAAFAQFEALSMMGNVICSLSIGCLSATSLLMLVLYIKNYIDEHKKEIGILKAMGYSNVSIAKSFWVFGFNVFLGALLGFIGSHFAMPMFYEMQNEEHIIPEVLQQFHPELLLYLVILPAFIFACFAIVYSWRKLHRPVLYLLKEQDMDFKQKKHNLHMKWKHYTFLKGLKKMTIRNRISLSFFVFFGSFCFSSMLQMVGSMNELASEMMAMIMLSMGLILSCTILLLAIRIVVKGNTKTIAMMRIMGYTKNDCQDAILNGYRPLGYIGFLVGTVYQFGLIQIIIHVVFENIDNLPSVQFDWMSFVIVLVAFVCFYEYTIHVYAKRVSSISIKAVMNE